MSAFVARSIKPLAAAAVFSISLWSSAQNPTATHAQDWIDLALSVISAPTQEKQHWDYIMNAKIRLLLFWKGAEDVGAGEIVKGAIPLEPSATVIKLLIGSDPSKAPRKINYWGSAIEVQRPVAGESAFFGFRKLSKGRSPKEAEKETEAKMVFPFNANLSYANSEEFVARAVSVESSQDFTFREFDMARQAMLNAVTGSEASTRRLQAERAGCSKTSGFLGAVDRLVQRAIEHTTESAADCYVYNARYYTITLNKNSAVPAKQVKFKLKDGTPFERNYRDLTLAKFEILNTETRERTRFNLLLGTAGELRGVPVQIEYQPNWWFRVVLELQTADQG